MPAGAGFADLGAQGRETCSQLGFAVKTFRLPDRVLLFCVLLLLQSYKKKAVKCKPAKLRL